MSKNFIEHQTVDWVCEQVEGANALLRGQGIDPTSRMSFAVAAAAASVTPGELLAQMDYRARLQARKLAAAQPEEVELERVVNG
jgi:hypothetical protein